MDDVSLLARRRTIHDYRTYRTYRTGYGIREPLRRIDSLSVCRIEDRADRT